MSYVMSQTEKEIKLLVLAALRDNLFTASEPIQVHIRGRHVFLTGAVAREDLMYEAILTAESVSDLLLIHNRLQVREAAPQRERMAFAAV
jgi:osmotically-inducible protein OsmY